MDNARRLDLCHRLAIEANTILDAACQELAPAPENFDDTDVSLPAQQARVSGLVDEILDTRD